MPPEFFVLICPTTPLLYEFSISSEFWNQQLLLLQQGHEYS
jgi:hypothetical protein